VLSVLVAAPAASAADPIMPLSEVRPGMRCTGLSVIKGTEISSFDVEIVDVIAAETGLSGARILVRVSGPAVDATGIGPGFSGSPVICDGRNAGAISEGLGEYGNKTALATPIEEMIRDRPSSPNAARRDPALLRAARPLGTPLTVSGLTGPAATVVTQAARRARQPLIVAPAGPASGYAPVALRPGSAVAASISTGDLGLGAVGTVTYRDGEDIWAFGHPFEGLGRRELFLQDAYIYTVIQNPLGIQDLGAISYKLASTDGHLHGAITRDGTDAISGKVGRLPRSFPLHIRARNAAGERVTQDSLLADERHLGYGAGLSFVAPLGVTQALGRLMRDFGPVTFRMCAHFRVRERRRPLGFCNPYFSVDDAVADLSEAGAMIDFHDLSALHVERATVGLRARAGVKQDVLIRARGPRRVRKGQRFRVRLTLQRRRGARHRISVPVRVPRSIRPGRHRLTLRGTGSGFGGDALIDELIAVLEGALGPGGGPSEPRSVPQLARRLRSFRRTTGIQARFDRRPPRFVRRSTVVSYEGRVRLRLRVMPRAR
jgi:SpoIVB peptidase S55